MSTNFVGPLAILFAAGATAHNLEEALFLPAWGRAHPILPFAPRPRIYWVVTTSVSVALWIAALGAVAAPANREIQYALCGFAIAMAANAFLPHLALSVVTRSYAPGAATGALLNLPLGLAVVAAQIAGGALVVADLWSHALGYAVGLAILALGGANAAHAAAAWMDARRRPR